MKKITDDEIPDDESWEIAVSGATAYVPIIGMGAPEDYEATDKAQMAMGLLLQIVGKAIYSDGCFASEMSDRICFFCHGDVDIDGHYSDCNFIQAKRMFGLTSDS